MAKGKYIARMDDDDISELDRFEKQFDYMEENPDITVVGSFINIIGNTNAKSWVCETSSDILEFLMAFLNPLCHPTVMIRRSFFLEKGINYDENSFCAQEYKLWYDIIESGGKIANLPYSLVKYRVHPVKLTNTPKMKIIQAEVATQIKYDLLSRLSFSSADYDSVINIVGNFCRGVGSASDVIALLERIRPGFKEKSDYGYAGFSKFLSKLSHGPAYRKSLSFGMPFYGSNQFSLDNAQILLEASEQCKFSLLYSSHENNVVSVDRLCVAFAFDENYVSFLLLYPLILCFQVRIKTLHTMYIF